MNNGYCTWRLLHIFIISRSILFRIRNVSDKFVEEINKIVFNNFFFQRSCHFWDSVETHFRAGQATDDNMAHAHCMLDNLGYTKTHTHTHTHTHAHSLCLSLSRTHTLSLSHTLTLTHTHSHTHSHTHRHSLSHTHSHTHWHTHTLTMCNTHCFPTATVFAGTCLNVTGTLAVLFRTCLS